MMNRIRTLLALALVAFLAAATLPAAAQTATTPAPAAQGKKKAMSPQAQAKMKARRDAQRKAQQEAEAREAVPAGPPPEIAMGESPVPSINGARIVGATPGKPFLFLIPASGEGPLTYAAEGLPEGLTLDAKTGIITGSLKKDGETVVKLTVTGPKGTAMRNLKIVGGQRKLALTPPMGWNSWNVWARAVDAEKIRAAADCFIKTGLAAHGFQFVNIDDTWEAGRDAQGRIQTNEKFGDMKALADYVHSKGLKLGIYSSPGPKTCAGFEGSYQHEVQDATSYADWGIDYLKHDWCSYGQIYNQTAKTEEGYRTPYITMRKALDSVGRDIVYSLCQYGMGQVWNWGGSPEVGGNCWRTTGDIRDSWLSMSGIGFSESTHAVGSGPGHWNDPDMLVVGKVGWGPSLHPTRLNPDEQLTHISLWSLLAAPLLIGCDLTAMDDFTKALLTNDEIIAINQDPLGKQAVCVDRETKPCEIWARPLSDGTQAVGLFNRGKVKATAKVNFAKLGLGGEQPVRDLWKRKDVGKATDSWSIEVPPHGAVVVKIGTPKTEE